jgi:hypothetical protein
MKTTKMIATIALLGLIANTEARIKWTYGKLNELAYDKTAKLGTMYGIPFSKDTDTTERMTGATPLDGDLSTTYKTKTNVIRVKRLVTKSAFENTLFPKRNTIYTYEGFLEAVAKYPKFCDENHLTGVTDDDACRTELSTLFAHFAQESGYHGGRIQINKKNVEDWQQGLYHIHEDGCPKVNDAHCDYRSGKDSWATTAYPMPAGMQYYGRGPFQLSWNYNFGEFSEILGKSTYDGK